jgi:diguanylate cyclase (GGDEF)-like protein
MNRRDHTLTLEPATRLGGAVFDERGRLQGWTTAFAGEQCVSSDDLAGRSIADFLPEIDMERWVAIWRNVQDDEVERLCFGRAGPGEDNLQFIEVEVCKFLTKGGCLAKVEVRSGDGANGELRILQQEILEGMATGVAVPEIMELLCHRVEALAPSAICSVLTVDRQGRLHHLASPSLPDDYSRAIDGHSIGPKTGSCGTAAFRGEPVEVTDIASDPLWEDFKSLVLPLGLHACWSSPIKSSNGRVLGAFAFYFPVPRRPTALERQIVATCLHICAIALDHEQTRQRIYELAFCDPLTNLDNRIRFQQRVGEALSVIAETQQRLAVHYIGLDQFHAINDTLGHANGDEVLRVVAGRLKRVMRDGDIIARIGGDEFAVVQIGDLKAQDVAGLAHRIMDALERPYELCGQQLNMRASIGIALAPDDGATADELIKNAALALLRVKELGRGTYFFYEKALNARMQIRRRLEAGLGEALAAGEFELYYQPVLSLESLEITGAEALLRWRHGDRGMIEPSEFVSVAEETGLIVALGAWAIKQACSAAARWPQHVAIAVNLSPVQFERPGLVETVADALATSGLRASRLQLEITESVLLHDSTVNVAILDQLSDLGATIALDDFGTGYSSLSYLQRFAFDRLKIDHSFVKNINRNAGSLKIVRSIVMLAHSLGLAVTAEGVETDEQFAAIRGEGCDDVQGYYFGAPQPLSAFRGVLAGAHLGTSGVRTAI